MPYDDVIRRVADKHGVDPSLLWGVVKTESNFNPNAVSKAGAIGLGQLMPATAAQYGVDPHDPEQNLEGAAQHLAYLTKRFNGDTQKALAAYNAGEGRVDRGGPLPAETRAYVPKVLSNAKGYKPVDDVGHIDDEQLRLAYEMGKQQRQQHKDDEATLRAAYEKYHPTEGGGAAIVEGSARRLVSPGAAIGGTLGGIVGGMATAPSGGLGAIPGAVAGAAVGELAQQGFDTFTGSAYAPHSAEESAKRVGMEAGFAAAGEATAGAITYLRPVRYAQPRVLTPEQQQTKAVLDRHQIPYTPEQVTGNTFHNFAKSLADGGVLSQQTMQRFVKDQNAAIRDAAQGIADTMGQQVPADKLGLEIVKLIRQEDDTLTRTVISPLYNTIEQHLGVQGNGLLVDQRPVKQLFQQKVTQIEQAAQAQNKPSLLEQASYRSMKEIASLPDDAQWNHAHVVLKSIREDLRDLSNPLNVATGMLKDKAVLSQAEKALEKQLETALQTSANPAHQVDLSLWKQAQQLTKGRSEQFRNDIILRFMKTVDERGGEKGMSQLISSMTADDMVKVMNATQADPALQGAMRQRYLTTKIEQVGGLEEAEKPLDAERFRAAVFGKTGLDKRKAEVMFDPQQRQKLTEFINAVSDVQSAPKSQLGKYLMLLNGGAALTIPIGVYDMVAGNTERGATELSGAATVLLTPKLLAGMLTDPRKVEYLIQGLRYTITDRSNVLRVTRELIRLDQNFARAVQMGISAYHAEQTSGPLPRTAETVSKTIQPTLPQFGLGNFQP
jgi:hypothetical protein